MRVLLSCNNNKPTPGNAIYIDRIDREREREVEELKKKKKGAKVARCFVRCSIEVATRGRVLLFLHYTMSPVLHIMPSTPRGAPLFMRLTVSPHASERPSLMKCVYHVCTTHTHTQHVAKGEGKREEDPELLLSHQIYLQ